jgi:hypothetical protein
VEISVWKPRDLFLLGHERAVLNARAAATELSRARIERVEVELYVERRNAERFPVAGERPA